MRVSIDTDYEPLVPEEEKTTLQLIKFNLDLKRILVLFLVWIMFLLLQFLENTLVVCSPLYWVLNLLQGSILGVEVELPRKSYSTKLFAEDDERKTEKLTKIEDECFVKPHIFTLTIPEIDGGTYISVTIRWSQKILYRDGQFTLNIPYSFPEYVTPAGKKMSKKEKIQFNVNSGPGTKVSCKTISHPLKELEHEAGKLGLFYEADVYNWSSSDVEFAYMISSNRTYHGNVLLQSPAQHDADQREMFCSYILPGAQESRKLLGSGMVTFFIYEQLHCKE